VKARIYVDRAFLGEVDLDLSSLADSRGRARELAVNDQVIVVFTRGTPYERVLFVHGRTESA
jgi:hypothetical protein